MAGFNSSSDWISGSVGCGYRGRPPPPHSAASHGPSVKETGLGRVQVPQVRPSPPLWRLNSPKAKTALQLLRPVDLGIFVLVGGTFGGVNQIALSAAHLCMEFWIAFQAPAHPRVPAKTSLGDEPRLAKVRTRDAPASLGVWYLEIVPRNHLSPTDREL